MNRQSLLMIALGLFVFTAPLVSLVGQQRAPNPQWVTYESIPQSGIPIVYAKLNGGEGYRMAVDLSLKDVLLDEFIVAGAGMELESRGETQEIDFYGDKEKVPVNYLDSLVLGSAVKRVVKTLIIRGDDLGAATGIPVYGRIGTDFFESFRLTVYYPRKMLLVEPSPQDEVPPGAASFQIEKRALSVEVVVNGSLTERFVLDPGASLTMLDKKWASKQGLVEKNDHRVDLASIEIGGFRAQAVPAILENAKKWPYEPRPVGVIGASLLREGAVTYDFPRKLVWLRSVEEGTH
jgi:hypothetical protein